MGDGLRFEGHRGAVNSVACSPDGLCLATASDDACAFLWELRAPGASRTQLCGHGGAVNAVSFSPDGNLAATASNDGSAKLWDLSTGECSRTLHGHDGNVLSAAFAP